MPITVCEVPLEKDRLDQLGLRDGCRKGFFPDDRTPLFWITSARYISPKSLIDAKWFDCILSHLRSCLDSSRITSTSQGENRLTFYVRIVRVNCSYNDLYSIARKKTPRYYAQEHSFSSYLSGKLSLVTVAVP